MKNKILFVVVALTVLLGAFFLQSFQNKQVERSVAEVTEVGTGVETSTEVTTALERVEEKTGIVETVTTEVTTALVESVTATSAIREEPAKIVTKEETTETTTQNTVKLTVDYSVLKGKLNKADINGGVAYSGEYVTKDGDTAFDVLKNSMIKAGIPFEFSKTPAFNSHYIEGIDNVYEFDFGELSGWVYKVNGEFPAYSSSEYKVKAGDEIVFVYTCDLGKDAGNNFSS